VAHIVTSQIGLKDVTFNVNKMKNLGWKTSRDSDEAVREATRRLLAR